MKKLTYLFLALLIVACSDDSSDGSSNDTTAPIITLNGQVIATVNLNSTYTDAGATAVDDIDGDLTSSIITTGVVNTSIEGNYIITYTVSDSAGNTATTTRQVVVEDDGNQLFLEKYDSIVFEAEWATSDNTAKMAFLNTSEIRIYEYFYGNEVCYVHPIDGTWERETVDGDFLTRTTSLQGQTENSITIQYDFGGGNSELREYRVTFNGDVYRLLWNDGQDPDYISTDDELCF